MRIDLPCCGFKNCRYQFDGNCTNKNKYEKCEYQYLVSQLEQKKGTWVLTDGYRCSLCNYKLQTTGIPDTCPKCGASMLDTMTYPQVDGITPSVI